jgi:hypothetical protein
LLQFYGWPTPKGIDDDIMTLSPQNLNGAVDPLCPKKTDRRWSPFLNYPNPRLSRCAVLILFGRGRCEEFFKFFTSLLRRINLALFACQLIRGIFVLSVAFPKLLVWNRPCAFEYGIDTNLCKRILKSKIKVGSVFSSRVWEKTYEPYFGFSS